MVIYKIQLLIDVNHVCHISPQMTVCFAPLVLIGQATTPNMDVTRPGHSALKARRCAGHPHHIYPSNGFPRQRNSSRNTFSSQLPS
jgi:hypothetical protein